MKNKKLNLEYTKVLFYVVQKFQMIDELNQLRKENPTEENLIIFIETKNVIYSLNNKLHNANFVCDKFILN